MERLSVCGRTPVILPRRRQIQRILRDTWLLRWAYQPALGSTERLGLKKKKEDQDPSLHQCPVSTYGLLYTQEFSCTQTCIYIWTAQHTHKHMKGKSLSNWKNVLWWDRIQKSPANKIRPTPLGTFSPCRWRIQVGYFRAKLQLASYKKISAVHFLGSGGVGGWRKNKGTLRT